MSERSILDAKLDRSFDMLDADGDGRLSEADLASLTARLGAALGAKGPEGMAGTTGTGAAPAAPAAGAVNGGPVRPRQGFTAFWATDLRAMDADGDGAVERGEWRAGVRRAVERDREGFLDRLGAMLTLWPEPREKGSGGLIGRTDFTVLYGSTLGLPAAPLHEAFTTLDIDRDGRLSADDIRTAVEEYYTSESTDTPGNWLFGPL